MARKGLRTPGALRRSILADGWLSRYADAVRPAIRQQYQEAASRIEAGGSFSVDASASAAAKELEEAELPTIIAMIVQAYRIAGTEFGRKSHKAWLVYGKSRAEDLAEAMLEDESPELITRVHRGIKDRIATTSSIETKTTARAIERIIQRAATEGRTMREIAKDIQAAGVAESAARAEMLARTTTIWSFNEGASMLYKDEGVREMEWLTGEDDVTCEYCREMDGKIVEIDGSFLGAGESFIGDLGGVMSIPDRVGDVEHPPLHPNCVIVETMVLAPDVRAAFKMPYSGPIVDLTLADGGRLSCTENHMLLTPEGWIAACLLREGDDVIDASAIYSILADPHDDNEPTSIDKLVRSLAKSPGMEPGRVPVSPEDFHGDAMFGKGDIDIVGANRLLFDYPKVSAAQLIDDDVFISRSGPDPLLCKSNQASMLQRLALAADSIMGGRHESFAFAGRRLDHAQEHGFATSAGIDAGLEQSKANSGTRDPKSLRDLLFALAGKIPTNRILRINRSSFSGHVYDLLSSSSLYMAGGLLSSNCRCTLLPVVEL